MQTTSDNAQQTRLGAEGQGFSGTETTAANLAKLPEKSNHLVEAVLAYANNRFKPFPIAVNGIFC